MSKRKQKLNPISYVEKPPAWMTMPAPKKKTKEEDPLKELNYDEMIFAEAEAAEAAGKELDEYEIVYEDQQDVEDEEAEEEKQATEAEEVVRGNSKDRTREFINKELEKLANTLEQLVESDSHSYVVNFVLEMSGQAQKKLWEIQGLTQKK